MLFNLTVLMQINRYFQLKPPLTVSFSFRPSVFQGTGGAAGPLGPPGPPGLSVSSLSPSDLLPNRVTVVISQRLIVFPTGRRRTERLQGIECE